MNFSSRTLVALSVASFLFPSLCSGQVRTWVSPDGLDANPCTRDEPCRNFAAAITAVTAGGEVVALQSGGYGAMTITKSVSVVAPAGVHAAIAPTTGSAIAVDAGATAHVVLRNLYLNSQGAEVGIDGSNGSTATVAALYVENCLISGFDTYGIFFAPNNSGARLYVSDTVVRLSGSHGIFLGGQTSGRATLDSVRLHKNGVGVVVDGIVEATIRESVASGSASIGFAAYSQSKVIMEDSVASSNAYGFYAFHTGVMTMTRCAATSNTTGILGEAGGHIYVSDSTITTNNTGVSTASGGVISSRGNNTLHTNTVNGTFNQSFTAN